MYRYFIYACCVLLCASVVSCGGGRQQIAGLTAPSPALSPATPAGELAGPPAITTPRIAPPRSASSIAGPRFATRGESIDAGLDYLLTVRGTFAVDGVAYPNLWEWMVGDGVSYANMPGVHASCFLRAARSSTDPGFYRTEALKTVDSYLVPAYTTGALATSRAYAHDVYALYLAWEETGTESYLDLAWHLVGRTTSVYSGEAYADRMIVNRYSMAGWDAAAYIEAFYLVGEAKSDAAMMAWATAMADRMVYRWDDWSNHLGTGYWAWDWKSLSYGGMLKALSIVPDSNGAGYAGKIAVMRDWLLAHQNADGWFPAGFQGVGYDDVQCTAYALEGLNYDDNGATVFARVKAEEYLRSAEIQLASGQLLAYLGDPAIDICPETIFEGLMALASQSMLVDHTGDSFVTGGGWVAGVTDPKASFEFAARYENGALTGTFSYSDGSLNYDAAPVGWLYVKDADEAYFGGPGWGVYIVDGGNPGKGVDVLDITTSEGYHNHAYLGGGNIKIHHQ